VWPKWPRGSHKWESPPPYNRPTDRQLDQHILAYIWRIFEANLCRNNWQNNLNTSVALAWVDRQTKMKIWLAAGTGQQTGDWSGTYYHKLGASLKPIYAEIIGKWINLWHEQTGRNSKSDWLLELANGLAIGLAHDRHILAYILPSLKPIHAETNECKNICGMGGQADRNLKNDWPLALAIGPAIGLAHTSIN